MNTTIHFLSDCCVITALSSINFVLSTLNEIIYFAINAIKVHLLISIL